MKDLRLTGTLHRYDLNVCIAGEYSSVMPKMEAVTYLCVTRTSVFSLDVKRVIPPDGNIAMMNTFKVIEQIEKRAKLRDAMRHAMPVAAKFVDDLEKVFGAVRILDAEENGVAIPAEDPMLDGV